MYEHLLVALDGSQAAERVLEHAEALASAFHSKITLLRATLSAEMLLAETAASDATMVDVAPALDIDPVLDADHSDAVDYLEGVARRLRQLGTDVAIEEPQGPADRVIVDRAAELGVGLILMTTHGRSGLERVVFGSTADSVIRHAPCPVLLVHVRSGS